jgi:hypothetical protein
VVFRFEILFTCARTLWQLRKIQLGAAKFNQIKYGEIYLISGTSSTQCARSEVQANVPEILDKV